MAAERSSKNTRFTRECTREILMSTCEYIISAYEYSEKIHASDEIDSQHVRTSRGYYMCGQYCSYCRLI